MMDLRSPASSLELALPSSKDILRQTLPNGVTVLARENWSAPSIVVEGYLQAGTWTNLLSSPAWHPMPRAC